eukprot:s3671_g2.t1
MVLLMMRWQVRTRTPEESRMRLEELLPRREWADINVLLVGLGQMQQQASFDLISQALRIRRSLEALRLLQKRHGEVETAAVKTGVPEYAALLILVGSMAGYYVLMTLIILCYRRIRGPKHTALVITTRQRLLIFLNRRLETYGITQPWFEPLETVVNILFGADYVLQFYISRNKLEFLYSLMAFVDVVTLFPILVFNLVFSIDNDTSVVLRVIRVTKLFRTIPEAEETSRRELSAWLVGQFGDTSPIATDPGVSHGLLHRLDRMTSGLILWASSYRSYFAARLQFASRELRKEYTCLCQGLVPPSPHLMMLPLRPVADGQRRRMEVARDGAGKASVTSLEQVFHFELPEGQLSSLVMLQLHTGRQHQIRAHLSGCGHPLLGDVDYGASAASCAGGGCAFPVGASATSFRLCLHASALRYGRAVASLPWPPDLDLVREELRAMEPMGRAALRGMEKKGEGGAGGGNKKLADVGPWLRDKIVERFKQVKLPLTVKYIDPTYMIRAIKPNANDSVYCSMLSHNAVHAAMAGYTAITVGQINCRYVMLPIACVTKNPQKKVDLRSQRFQELVSTTLQPDFTPDGVELKVPEKAKENPLLTVSEPVNVMQALGAGEEVRRLECEHLSLTFGERSLPTTLIEQVKGGEVSFFDQTSWVTQTLGLPGVRLQMPKAGPRRTLYFKPADVAATIVTCGGLCPGLNNVIRELVMMLYAYGVKKVYGIKGGFKGVVNPQCWITLTPENVQDIHLQGGSILVSDRGNPPHLEMAKMLKKKGVRQHFVLGGDGTQKGAHQTYEKMQEIGWECAVVGVPKTIDNDINLLDRSFGFDTAMSEALKAIEVAYVEATCNANCIGLVKLMGRHCGYLTMMSVLAARHVDICLLPEMDINLDKVLDHCVELVSTSGSAVVVIAEGCGDTLMQSAGGTDEGGNKKISDVGPWLKDSIVNHFKTLKLPITIKYVDPTYQVRAVPANPNDSIYCSELAQAAVHAAMAGFTGLTVGKVDQHVVYLPIKLLVSMPSRIVDVNGRWFEALRTTTQQPNLAPWMP